MWDVVVADFEGPDGEPFERDIVRSPGRGRRRAAGLRRRGQADRWCWCAQYRPPFERVLVEIPAGMRDVEGEPTEETARRELAEEVGLRRRVDLRPLFDIIASPG